MNRRGLHLGFVDGRLQLGPGLLQEPRVCFTSFSSRWRCQKLDQSMKRRLEEKIALVAERGGKSDSCKIWIFEAKLNRFQKALPWYLQWNLANC
eukprot:g19325.t1